MTLFWHPAGLKISYNHDALVVEDLNPEKKIEFRMTSSELLKLGFNCIRAACWPRY